MPLILDICNDNRTLDFADGMIIVRHCDEVVATIALREVMAVAATAQNAQFGLNFLQALSAKNIPFVTTDKNFSPVNLLIPCFYAENKANAQIKQLEAKKGLYKKIWQAVVVEKIKNRAKVLRSLRKKDKLQKFINKVLSGDKQNINKKAENLYFSEMFGADFEYAFQPVGINAFLQYGYMLLQIVALRYVWEQGLNPSLCFSPDSKRGYLELAKDLTEPFKPLTEKLVYDIFNRDNLPDTQPLTAEYRAEMLQLFNKTYYDGKRLRSLFELIKKTVVGLSSTLRASKMRLTFSDYLIEVKEI